MAAAGKAAATKETAALTLADVAIEWGEGASRHHLSGEELAELIAFADEAFGAGNAGRRELADLEGISCELTAIAHTLKEAPFDSEQVCYALAAALDVQAARVTAARGRFNARDLRVIVSATEAAR